MQRFYVYLRLKGVNSRETAIAEGVRFSNGNITMFEYITSTISILDGVDSIKNHYDVVGIPRIEWLDFDKEVLKIN